MAIKNTFFKGLDKDTNHNIVAQDKYIDAKNMTLTGEDNFWELSSLKGSEALASLNTGSFPGFNVLAAVDCVSLFKDGYNGQVGDEYRPTICYFVYADSLSIIYIYDIVNDNIFAAWETNTGVDSTGFPPEGTVDTEVNREKNIENIYFVDNKNVPRKIELSFENSNPVGDWRGLSLIKYAPLNNITDIDEIENQGLLSAGTYAFSFRYYNVETGLYSKWSPISNEFPIISTIISEAAGGASITGDLPGASCAKALAITIDNTNPIKTLYNAIQLAVVKRIDGTKTTPIIANKLTPKKEFYDLVEAGDPIVYKGGQIEEEFPLSEITVGEAPIKTAKTITIKDNRIFLGNVQYFNRVLETATVGDAQLVRSSLGDKATADVDESKNGYKVPKNTYNRLGYFRDETYRFGIVYTDEWGNSSNVVPIDFSQLSSAKKVDPVLQKRDYINAIASPSGGIRFEFNSNVSSQFEVDRYVQVEHGTETSYLLIREVEYIGGLTTYVYTTGNILDITSSTGFLHCCDLSFYNNADPGSKDFRFPPRLLGKYNLLYDFDELQVLGLQITGINNHPDWAKAIQVVRTERIKKIVDQTVHLPCAYVGPADVGFFGDSRPTLIHKKLSQTITRNIGYQAAASQYVEFFYQGIDALYDVANITQGQNLSGYGSAVYPPTWLYNLDGTPFSTDVLSVDTLKFDIVDSITLWLNSNSGSLNEAPEDYGVAVATKYLTLLAPRDHNNYFYKKLPTTPVAGVTRVADFKYAFNFPYFFEEVSPRIVDFTQIVSPGDIALLNSFIPEIPPNYEALVNYLNVTEVAKENNQNAYPYNATRHLFYTLDSYFGDIAYLSSQGSINTNRRYYDDILHYNLEVALNGVGSTNIKESNMLIAYNSIDTGGAANLSPNAATPVGAGTGEISQALMICNIVNGADDNRYGSLFEVQTYKPTGYYSQISSPTTSIGATVFGGDCFVGVQRIKPHNSWFYLTPNGSGLDTLESYNALYEHAAYLIESEVNTSFHADKGILPVTGSLTPQSAQTDYDYSYNPAYTPLNNFNTYTSLDETQLENNINLYPSRIIWSNIQITNSDEGFNTYPVANFFDLETVYGGITKLVKLNNNNIYALQEKGVCIVPVNKRVIEDAEGSQLVINTGSVVTEPNYLLTKNGCQHIRTVSVSEDHIFFTDVRKKEVFKIGGSSDSKISDQGMHSYFTEKFDSITFIPEKTLMGAYDYNNNEYILYQQDFEGSRFVVIWSDKVKGWVSELDIDANVRIDNFIYANKELYLVGETSDTIQRIEKMYQTDVYTEILGQRKGSSFNFVVNQEHTKGKIFDNMSFVANNRLSTMTLEIEKELEDNDISLVHDLNLQPRHDCYVLPTLRGGPDGSNIKRRMRGKYMVAYCTIDNASNEVRVSAVETTARLDPRLMR